MLEWVTSVPETPRGRLHRDPIHVAGLVSENVGIRSRRAGSQVGECTEKQKVKIVPVLKRPVCRDERLKNSQTRLWIVLPIVWALLHAPVAAASCRLALVLALDASASVDAREYALQLEAIAVSLDDPDVRDLLLSGPPAHVSLSVFEWSATSHKIIVLPWTELTNSSSIDAAVTAIRAHVRTRAGSRTGIGTALAFANTLLSQRAECWQHKIDVSGDGKSNVGPSPSYIRSQPQFSNVTINGLVILEPEGGAAATASTGHIDQNFDLRAYFDRHVIHGPDAFTVVARGYENYAEAMRRKLLREIQVPVIGLLKRRTSPDENAQVRPH